MITSVATQGHAFSDAVVSAFHVSSSDDGHYWRSVYTENTTNKEALTLLFISCMQLLLFFDHF